MPKKPITPWTFVIDSPLRILIVDDDPILREFASVHLGSPFTTIDMACNGVEAKALLAQTPYDVALLDIEMPELDGSSLLEEIRSDPKLRQLRVIMLTGHDDIASIDRAYQLGADSFVTKPVNWRQLSYQIRYVVRIGLAESLQAISRDLHTLSDLEAGDGSIQALMQSIIDHADVLERQLTVDKRRRFSRQIQALRRSARALAECLATSKPDIECTDRDQGQSPGRNLTDKRTDVVDLQL
jgi:CheY-like chemotaxis protein